MSLTARILERGKRAYARSVALELAHNYDRIAVTVIPADPDSPDMLPARINLQPSVTSASMCLSLEPDEARELAAMLTTAADELS